jgi:mRNA interferase MazF
MSSPNRGEVWLANLNPGRGTEPGKARPVIIVQSQALLEAGHPSTLVVPLTTQRVAQAAPLRIRVPATGKLTSDSDALVDQVRAVDNRRLTQGPVARCAPAVLAQLDAALRELLDLDLAT